MAALLLPLLAAPVIAQDAVQADLPELGSGELRIRVERGEESLLIGVGTTLPHIGGIVLRETGSERDLVRLVTNQLALDVASALSSRAAEANVTIAAGTIEGSYDVRVPGSLETSSLETILIRTDGSVYTFVGKGAPTDGWFETTLRFPAPAAGPERCVDVELECSNGCKTEETCCGTLVTYCFDCTVCEITCSPCEILP
jgi:hypothetical protein